MAIIGTLPNTLAAGQVISATPLMNDFNYIVNQVNANSAGVNQANTFSSMQTFNGGATSVTPASGDNSTNVATTAFVQSSLPSGTILDFAGGTPPSGFLLCDGSAVSRLTYAALFAAIGTLWGAGDGSTTFNVPDLRSYVTAGAGVGLYGVGSSVGNRGGEQTHTLSVGEVPGHTHNYSGNTGTESATHTHTDAGHVHQIPRDSPVSIGTAQVISTNQGISNFLPINSGTGYANLGVETATHYHGIAGTTDNGNGTSGSAHNNVQPTAIVLKIIKA